MIASPGSRTAQMLLTFAAILLVVFGLVIVYLVPNGLELGLVICLMGGGLFLNIAFRPPPTRLAAALDRLHLTPAQLLVGLAVGWSLLAVFANNLIARQIRFDFSLTWLLWALSIASLLAAFAKPPTGSLRTWLKAHQTELLTLGLLTLLSGVLRFYELGDLPRVIDGDEGLHGLYALTTTRGNLSNPFSLFANIGSLYLHAINWAIAVFGRTPFGLRFVPALAGSLAVPAAYLLARQLFGRRIAVYAALLLAASHAHLHFSRIASVPYILGTFLIPLEIFLFIRALQRRSLFSAALGGVVLAIHFSVYLTAQIVAALLVVFVVILILARQPLIRQGWRAAAVFAVSAVIVALPQLAYNFDNPDQFLSRLNTDGVFQSGWLAAEMAATGRSEVHVLADRVAHVFLSLIAYPAIDFYGSPLPVLDLVTAGLFLLGLIYALLRTRAVPHLLLNGYFWSLVVSIGLFAAPPGADSYRAISTLPAAMTLAAIGLDQIVTAINLNQLEYRRIRTGVLAVIFSGVLLFNLNAYFGDYAGRCRFGGDLGTRFASYLGNYLRQVDRESSVYLLSSYEARYGVHLSIDFLSKSKRVENVDGPPSDIPLGPNVIVITSPARANELRDWARANPGGELHYEYDCENLILLSYRLP